MLGKQASISYIDFMTVMTALFAGLYVTSADDPAKQAKGTVVDPSYLLATIEWDSKSNSDVDLYMKTPTGQIVYFKNKDIGVATLDKDDMGATLNRVETEAGVYQNDHRREVISLKAPVPGRYTINVEMYRKAGVLPDTVKAQVLGLAPYKELIEEEFQMTETNQEHTVINFEIDSTGHIVSSDKAQVSLMSEVLTK